MQTLYQDTARDDPNQKHLQVLSSELEDLRVQLDTVEGSMERCRQVTALAKRMVAAAPPPRPVML